MPQQTTLKKRDSNITKITQSVASSAGEKIGTNATTLRRTSMSIVAEREKNKEL